MGKYEATSQRAAAPAGDGKKKKHIGLWITLAVLAVVTVSAGVAINALGLSLGGSSLAAVSGAAETCCLTLFERLCGAALLVLLGWGMYRKLLHA